MRRLQDRHFKIAHELLLDQPFFPLKTLFHDKLKFRKTVASKTPAKSSTTTLQKGTPCFISSLEARSPHSADISYQRQGLSSLHPPLIHLELPPHQIPLLHHPPLVQIRLQAHC
uniref:Uncharacterized protein n=1 Tax=Arundo donax TaxID=35708 RepID=A0A0A9G210_ARUDO